jgi:hypothetical protein
MARYLLRFVLKRSHNLFNKLVLVCLAGLCLENININELAIIMRHLFLFFIIFIFTHKIVSQDTLRMGNKSYILNRTKTFYPDISFDLDSPISLPSQYTKSEKKLTFNYIFEDCCKNYLRYNEYTSGLGDINTVITKIWSCDSIRWLCDSTYRPTPTTFTIESFIDTIIVKLGEKLEFNSYIISNRKKIIFTGYEMIEINKGILSHLFCNNSNDGELFSAWSSLGLPDKPNELKKSTFIINKLYYRRGDATYRLDKQFVVLFK